MPQVIPAIIGSITVALKSIGVAAWLAAGAATLAVNTAISVGLSVISSAFAGRQKAASFNDPGAQLRLALNSNAARSVVYGETVVAGQLIFKATTGDDNKYFHMIIALGDGGPYESIEAIYFNKEEVTIADTTAGSGVYVTSPSKWANSKARIECKLGSESQTAFSEAVSEISEWTSDHRGRGVALAYVRLEYDPEVWTTGKPDILFKVRGRKVYDAEGDTGGAGDDPDNASFQSWSENPAMWALDYLRGVRVNSQRIAGIGVPDALVEWASFETAQGVCDETVAAKAGGTIARYSHGGGQISADDEPLTVLEAMVSGMGGVITTRSGKVAAYAAEAQTATVTLTDDDLAGPIKVISGKSIRDTANAISGQYREPLGVAAWTSAPPYRNSTWETEDDSEVLWTELSLPFSDDHRVVQRLCKIFGGDNREPHVLEGRYKIKALQIHEGEVFTLDSDSYGAAANGKFRLIKRTINPDSTVDIVARSETDTKYDWTAATDERDAANNGAVTQVEPTPATPTGWTATVAEITGPQNAQHTVIDIAAPTIPTSAQLVEIQYMRQEGSTLGLDFLGGQYSSDSSGAAADSDFIPVATLSRAQAANGYRITGVEQARGYAVRVRYINFFEVAGSWLTIEVASGAAGGAIVAPTGWTAAASTQTSAEGYTRPVLTVTPPTAGLPVAASLVAIDYRESNVSDFAGQVTVSRSEASYPFTLLANEDTDYVVRVRYGVDGNLWGPAFYIRVFTAATSALSLSSFALAANDTASGGVSLPGFEATWDALTGDELRRANAITLQYRRDTDTDVSTATAEPDAASLWVWGLLPSVTYNVRARVEEVYQAGAWTAWTNVTTSANQIVGGFDGQGGLATLDFTTLGTNVRGSDGTTVLNDADLFNTAITINSNGTLGGAGSGTVTLGGIGAGDLAPLDTISRDEVASGYALFETGSGAPTATRERTYRDTSDGTLWSDDGSNVKRTNSQLLTGAATEDTYTATVPTVVAKVHYPSVSSGDELKMLVLETAYTDSASAATHQNVQAQWSIYAIVDASNGVAAGDNALTAGTARALVWDGATAGLTFQLSGSDVLEDANDLSSARADKSLAAEYYFGTNASTFDGENVTIALCIDITSAPSGSDGVNLDVGTTFTARLSS